MYDFEGQRDQDVLVKSYITLKSKITERRMLKRHPENADDREGKWKATEGKYHG